MKTRSHRGFSLLEVLVALVILGLVLPGLVAMFLGSKSAQVGSQAAEEAVQLAEGKLDSLRWMGKGILAGPKSVNYNKWSPDYQTTITGKPLTWHWKIEHLIDNPAAADNLTVEVRWMQGSTPHSISLNAGVLL